MQADNRKINTVLHEIVLAAKNTLGERLDKIILFGSYARDDYDEESDIDICILADVPRDEAIRWRTEIKEYLWEVELDYDILVSMRVINNSFFYNHLGILPFYRNVLHEGVEIYGQGQCAGLDSIQIGAST